MGEQFVLAWCFIGHVQFIGIHDSLVVEVGQYTEVHCGHFFLHLGSLEERAQVGATGGYNL